MNVARLNFSHGTYEEHGRTIALLKKVRKAKGVPLAIMLDNKGPEIRLGIIQGGELVVRVGQKIELHAEGGEGTEERWSLTPYAAIEAMEKGMKLLLDNGYLLAEVVEKRPRSVVIQLTNSGTIRSHKSVAIPGARVALPAVTDQDRKDLAFGCEQGIDLVAASFIRSAEHVLAIKELLSSLGRPDILVLAKIENHEGIKNFDAIVEVADGIMVARGDLGVELPLTQVPVLQKMMIRKCHQSAKPVVVATQMLESMINSPLPTRAEVSDVANAIYESASGVMLSGETAMGKYPVETVRIMREIALEAEKAFDYREFFYRDARQEFCDVPSSVALASVKTAYSAGAKAIFVFTSSGFTARLISRFRPEMPILALTGRESVYHQMALYWGVQPVDPVTAQNMEQAFTEVGCFALGKGYLHFGDLVVVTAGAPFGISGTTNTMMVESLGDVLVRGHLENHYQGKKVQGRIAHLFSAGPSGKAQFQEKIVVMSRCDASYQPLLEGALALVLQNHPEDPGSKEAAVQIARALNIPLLTGAEHALSILKDGQAVTLDPAKGIVYKGTISSDEEMIERLCERTGACQRKG